MEEFCTLENTEQKVLLWLTGHAKTKTVMSWLEFIAADYKRRRALYINISKLYQEIEVHDGIIVC